MGRVTERGDDVANEYVPALLPRVVSSFSGMTGFVIKVAFLCVLNGLVVWAAMILVTQGRLWWGLSALAVVVALDFLYLLPGDRMPAKFIAPGAFFLVAYLLVPIMLTVLTAFQFYGTGHIGTKAEAIDANLRQTLVASDKYYVMTPAHDADGVLVLLLVDEASGEPFVGTSQGLSPLSAEDVTIDEFGAMIAEPPYRAITQEELTAMDAELAAFEVPTRDGAAIKPEGFGFAVEAKPGLEYDAATDSMVNTETGTRYYDNKAGSFVSVDGEELLVGWRAYVGWDNFSSVINNKFVRDPFIRAFIWTVVFAGSAVALSFAIGLALALMLEKKGFRFKRFYRSMLVVPYAVPGFLSLLVWAGLLNDDFGVINRLLPVDIPWLFNAWWARVSVIAVTTWLTVPYFMLVSMGALQSIPSELLEAAHVDGASKWQSFRRVTLPLLLSVVTPLLVASFAFNFNNFNNIFLLTGGGPVEGEQSIAGATDILISYTYKIAFASGKGQDYGLASAMSIFIFFIVAAISAVGFSRSKAMENMR